MNKSLGTSTSSVTKDFFIIYFITGLIQYPYVLRQKAIPNLSNRVRLVCQLLDQHHKLHYFHITVGVIKPKSNLIIII